MGAWRGLLAALAILCLAPAVAAAAPRGVTLAAAFDPDARLGQPSALHIALKADPRRLPSPISRVDLLYPRTLGVTTSGLGIASCRRPPSDFTEVIVNGLGLLGCSPNAILGRGDVRAEVRLGKPHLPREIVPEHGRITLMSGPVAPSGRLTLVALVDAIRPFGGKLLFSGEVQPAPAPFGGALSVGIKPVPQESYADVEVALTTLQLTIGPSELRYRKRRGRRMVLYRPEGIVLPRRCPRVAFPFRARVAFADGTRRQVRTTIRCPRPRGR